MVPRPKRRVTDNPDWKHAAPRWLLVAGCISLLALASINVRAHIAKTDETSARVADITRKVTQFEAGLDGVNCQLLDTRLDMLRFQEYAARRNKDTWFADQLRLRVTDTELSRNRHPECDKP